MVGLILIVIVLVALPLLPEIKLVITWLGSWLITGSLPARSMGRPQCV